MCAISVLLLSFALFAQAYQQHPWKTIFDRIQEETDFSGFRTMVKNNKDVTINLLYSGVTVFVPQNEAISRYDGFYRDVMVLYHVGTEASTLKDLKLNHSLQSVYSGNPPIWVTVVDDGYYVNNAKIVEKYSNYVAKCKRNTGLNQVLHVVDRVLDPMLHTPYENPSAYDFLENYQNWKLGGRKVSEFFKRVQFHHKEDLFKKKGGHTFFVPIDDKAHDHRLQAVDGYVIEGHVIPNVVLFTRPTPQIYHETMVNYDYIYIVASMLQNHGKDSVKSVTVVGDSGHKKGEIVAEIVVGNIPVTNGVVHLISQPLAVFDRELKPFPYLSVAYKVAADPELNITHLLAKKGRVGKILRTEKGMYTVFAPKNHAWNDYLGYNSEDLSDILARHVVVSDTRLTMSKLATAVLPTETLGGSVNLRAVSINGTFFLSWGEKKVRVIRADYECSDGVVHVIDDILADPKPRVAISTDYSLWKFLKDLVGT